MCPAISACEIVVCSSTNSFGKMRPIATKGCEISCNQRDTLCTEVAKGRLEWYPYNPCRVTTTTSTTTTTTTTTPIPPSPTFRYPPTFESTTLSSFHYLPEATFGQAPESIIAPAEPNAQKKKQTYGLSWLVSEPELELILWVMFGVALMLMILGLVGLVGFIWYKRRIKKQLKVSTSPRYYDVNRQRAYGVVAYEPAAYTPGLEYEKLRGAGGNCFWTQRPDSRTSGTVRPISSPQVALCSPFCTAKRQQGYLHHVAVPTSSYRPAEMEPVHSSTYQLVTFAPSVDNGCKPVEYDEYLHEVPCIRGIESGRASPGLPNASSPIPLGGDTYLVSSFHRTSGSGFRDQDLEDALEQEAGQKQTNV